MMVAKLNIPLLMRIIAKIEQEPTTMSMEQWILHNPLCGTEACIAGHAVLMQDTPEAQKLWQNVQAGWHPTGIPRMATEALFHPRVEFDNIKGYGAYPDAYLTPDDLYYVSHWDREKADRLTAAKAARDPKAYVAVVKERILEFIEDWKAKGWPYTEEEKKPC